ncbi:MAG: hypothetical protein JW864_01020 [Spirochaetes bacterium]|nr:hypothetical protein [Spirochaetota bacterium]
MSDDQTMQTEEAPKEEEVKAQETPKEASAEATREEQAAPAEAPKAEASDQGAAAEAPGKKKKINKLTLDEISRQIDKLEKADQSQSRYYKHLQNRKDELQQTA